MPTTNSTLDRQLPSTVPSGLHGSAGPVAGRIEYLAAGILTGWVISNEPNFQPSFEVTLFGVSLKFEVTFSDRPDVAAVSHASCNLGFVIVTHQTQDSTYLDLLSGLELWVQPLGSYMSKQYVNSFHYDCLSDDQRNLPPFLAGSRPLISVVMPVYDRVQPLRESIKSILHQNYDNFELIIVGDNPPIDTLSVLSEFSNHPKIRVRIFPDRSGNACRGRNVGITMAKGEIIALQDSDDISFPDRLAVAVKVFTDLNHGKTGLLYTGIRVLTDASRTVGDLSFGQRLLPSLLNFEQLKDKNPMFTFTVCMRRDLLLLRGAFRREMIYREDHELWLRLAFHGLIAHAVPEALGLYRIHSGNAELTFISRDDHWKNEMIDRYSLPWTNNWTT